MPALSFILAGISGAIEPTGTGRLSGCRARAAATSVFVPLDSARGIPCQEAESPAL